MTTYTSNTSSIDLRNEVVSGVVKGRADASYKFKQAVAIETTNAWKNTFFREDDVTLAGSNSDLVKGVPRGAAFPRAKVTWQEISATVDKYGLEDFIYYEDILMGDLDVMRRTLFRIAEGVTKAVDDEIWDKLSESQSPSAIQSITITNGQTWDATSAAILDNLFQAKQLIAQKNYSTENLMLFVNPRDYRSIMKHITDKGAQYPRISEGIASNGKQGNLAGIDIIMSNSVTTSYALVCVPKVCGTWRAAVPLQTNTTEDPYKGTRIRAVEMGVTQVTDPNAIVLIANTDGGS